MAKKPNRTYKDTPAGEGNSEMFSMDKFRTKRQYGTKKTQARMELFLLTLAQPGCTVSKAAQTAGIDIKTAYNWKKDDLEFAEAWNYCYDEGTELLIEEATRRGVEGIDKPIFYQGELIDTVKEYSDTLLVKQLEARRPADYRPRATLEATGPVTVVIKEFAYTPPEEVNNGSV